MVCVSLDYVFDSLLTRLIAVVFGKIDKDLGTRIRARTEAMASAPKEHLVTQHYLL